MKALCVVAATRLQYLASCGRVLTAQMCTCVRPATTETSIAYDTILLA